MNRKLDAAIAKLLGWEDILEGEFFKGHLLGTRSDGIRTILPEYSTDGNAMLELDREMRKRGWVFSVARTSTKRFVAYYETRDDAADGVADTEPLARALAAYKALTGKEWRG